MYERCYTMANNVECKRINIRVPLELYSFIKDESDNLGVPVSSFFNIAAKEYLKTNSILNLSKIYEALKDKPTE
jgi:hypothetical protein